MSRTVAAPVRIAIIGTGGISGAHAPGYKKLADKLTVVALCDVNPEAMAARSDQLGGIEQRFTDWNVMFRVRCGRASTPSGWSHSWVTPTTSALRPRAQASLGERGEQADDPHPGVPSRFRRVGGDHPALPRPADATGRCLASGTWARIDWIAMVPRRMLPGGRSAGVWVHTPATRCLGVADR